MNWTNVARRLWRQRRLIVIILTPLLLLPLPIVGKTQASYVGYLLVLMAVYWLSEVIPLAATALIPVVLVPAFGIMSTKQISQSYMKDTNMLFIGGLLIATAIEYRNLHKRIALFVLCYMGSDPKWLIMGFMLPTWFLSMWISNTAATAMMIAIVDAVLGELSRCSDDIELPAAEFSTATMATTDNEQSIRTPDQLQSPIDSTRTLKSSTYDATKELVPDGMPTQKQQTAQQKRMAVALNLSICYAATCGGIATLTGTAPNMLVYGLVRSHYGQDTGLNFGTWMGYATPISFICLFVTWGVLCTIHLGPKTVFCRKKNPEEERKVKRLMTAEYKNLGPVSFAEGSCIFLFFVVVVLWLTREPGVKGWSRLFEFTNDKGVTETYVSDSQSAMLVGILVLLWPARNPFRLNGEWSYESENHAAEVLLPWNVVQTKFPWGVVLLLGGGFALADACEASQLSKLIGEQLRFLGTLPPAALVFVVALGTAMLTEVTSNTATASILIPILMSLAECINLNPLYLALPATIASSFAFCLPVATPPNAVVFGKGHVTVIEMVKAGIWLNVINVVVLLLATISYAMPLFNLGSMPIWARECPPELNSTLTTTSPYSLLTSTLQ